MEKKLYRDMTAEERAIVDREWATTWELLKFASEIAMHDYDNSPKWARDLIKEGL